MSTASRSPRDSGRRKTQNKTSLALRCVTCRKKKVKCSGTVPCEYCYKRGLECSIPLRQERRVYSVTHVEDLENRLAQYEGLDQDRGEWLPDATDDPPQLVLPSYSDEDSCRLTKSKESIRHWPRYSTTTRHACRCVFTNFKTYSQTRYLDTINGPMYAIQLRERRRCMLKYGPAIETDSSLSSSATFGFRVQNLLSHARPTRHTPETPQPTPAAHAFNNSRPSPRQTNISHNDTLPLLPSESEAYRLLEFVSLYIGQSQSHFDVREVSDNIELHYTDPEGHLGPPTPWFLRMSIIFAVGKLLSGDSADHNGDAYPGSGLFEFVHSRLPTPSEQHAQGRVAIETLTLLGVYLQAMNRKEEAYIYTSIALRLAVTHGYHRPLEGRQILRSEKSHIGRLWWTIYMQERRLAAATGHPYGIDDAFIVLEYPIDQPGFSSSQPIRTNARIARITSRILIDLYNPKRQNQDSFVLDVKEIIKCLHDISREIPESLATVAHGPNANTSVRTTASLQLMLYQATLLTIRPVMLHVAHLILAGESSVLEQLGNSSLAQLCRACTEAARRIVRTILTLRKMNLLAIFGFFDCDAIFSATFVLILTVVFDSACEDKDKINPSPGIGEALESLKYLADNHNTTAIERLQEVHNIWHHLSEHLQINESIAAPPRSRSQPAHESARQLADGDRQGPIFHENTDLLDNNVVTDNATQVVTDPGQTRQESHPNSIERDNMDLGLDAQHFVPDVPSDMSQAWIPSSVNMGTLPSDDLIPMDIPLDEYYGYFQSLLDNSDWYLTGQDVGDLAEFGRHVVNFSRSE